MGQLIQITSLEINILTCMIMKKDKRILSSFLIKKIMVSLYFRHRLSLIEQTLLKYHLKAINICSIEPTQTHLTPFLTAGFADSSALIVYAIYLP